jgi:hypothetical protein
MTRGEVNRLLDAIATLVRHEAPAKVSRFARVHNDAGQLVHQTDKGTMNRKAAEEAHVMTAVALVRELDAWIAEATIGEQPACGRNLIVSGGARRCRRCTSPIDTTEADVFIESAPGAVAAWAAGFCCMMCMLNDARDQHTLGTAWWLKRVNQ